MPSADQRAFVEALIALEPVLLAPLRSQLADCGIADVRSGWLIFRVSSGEPCAVLRGYTPPALDDRRRSGPGPQGLYDLLLWVGDDGMLSAIELLMLEDGKADCAAMARWLRGEEP